MRKNLSFEILGKFQHDHQIYFMSDFLLSLVIFYCVLIYSSSTTLEKAKGTCVYKTPLLFYYHEHVSIHFSFFILINICC